MAESYHKADIVGATGSVLPRHKALYISNTNATASGTVFGVNVGNSGGSTFTIQLNAPPQESSIFPFMVNSLVTLPSGLSAWILN